MRNTLILKVPEGCLEFPLSLFVRGMRTTRLRLLELHSDTDSTINKTYFAMLTSIALLRKRNLPIVVSLLTNRRMTWKGKRICSNVSTLSTSWSVMLARELTGRGKDFVPFWNEQSKETSQKLWWPTETDSVGSPSNSSSLSVKSQKLNSLFSTKTITNLQTQTSPTTYSPSSTSTPVDLTEGAVTRCRKVRIYPTKEQRQTLKKWMGTSRYVYNKCLHTFKEEGGFFDTYKMRDRFVTNLHNPNIEDWECETPKDIRYGAVRDLGKSIKTAFDLKKAGKIDKFQLKYRRKKDISSIEIPSYNAEFVKISERKYMLKVFVRKLGSMIKCSRDKCLEGLSLEKYSRLMNVNGKWYISVPIKVNKTKLNLSGDCGLDPGSRKFQTVFSEREMLMYSPSEEFVDKLRRKNSMLNRLRSEGKISKSHYQRSLQKQFEKYGNCVDEAQFRLRKYLCTSYSTVYLPKFESQKLVKINRSKKFRQQILSLKHYQFRVRMLNFAETTGCDVKICGEHYTTKTCGRCGTLNNIGASEIFDCKSCFLKIDRDVNASRNILIKNRHL